MNQNVNALSEQTLNSALLETEDDFNENVDMLKLKAIF